MSTQSELIFNRFLTNALGQKATEMYLSVGTVPLIRKDGLIRQMVGETVINKQFLEEMIKILFNSNEQERFRSEKEVLVTREFGRAQRFRLTALQERSVPALNIKFIPNQIISLEQLRVRKSVRDLTGLDNGLVIISGQRDSGRSTLILALLDLINKNQQKYIATLERPVEYFFLAGKCLVEQREVGQDTPDFLTGISSLKTRNVDVVFVSEASDPEVILAILEIAQSNALVFTIMSTDTALKTIQRIFNYFPREKQDLVRSYFTDIFKSIICTRLIPRVGGGRVLAMEILNATPIIQKAIREQRLQQVENILQTGLEGEAAISLDRYLAELVKDGQVLSAEAIKCAVDKEGFQSLIRE